MSVNQQIESWLLAHKAAVDTHQKPFITLSYAQGWDGSITSKSGASLALSGLESTRLTHQLRSLHDGILVGIGTVLADDPQLTVREWPGANPQPIVLDSKLRLPASARLCQHADRQCWVLTSQANAQTFSGQAEIMPLATDALGRIHLPDALHLLWQKGIKMLMVEGGSQVITAFLKAQLADAIVLTIAPTLVGGYKAIGNLDLVCKSQMPHIRPVHTQVLGEDLIMWGDLHYPEASV